MTDSSTTGTTSPAPVPFATLDKKLDDPAVRRRPSSLFAAHGLAEAESGDLRFALGLADQAVRDVFDLLDESMAMLRRQALAAGFYAQRAHELEEALAEAAGIDPHHGRQQ